MSRPRPQFSPRPAYPFLKALLASVGISATASAATFTWDGGGADTKASNALNWVGDAVPLPAGFDIIFSGTSAIGTTVNWDYGQNFRTLTFGSAALGYTIGGATPIQFVSTGVDSIANNSANAQIITDQVNVFFNGSKRFNANTANITLSGVTFRADTMAVGEINTLTLSGSANGLISGAINTGGTFTNLNTGLRNSLVKTGSGTWELAGVNTYGGLTNVQAGTLTLSGNRTTAMVGGITLGGGGAVAQTLNIQNGNFSLGASYSIGNGGSTATVNHTAGTIAATGGSQILLGNGDGSSTYNLTGGALSGSIRMGVNLAPTASVNVFNLGGTGALTTSSLQIGRSDTAGSFKTTNTFDQTAGTATVTTLALGGSASDSALVSNITGTLNLTGGTFTSTTFSSLSAAGGDVSSIVIGGTANVSLGAFPTARGTGATATLTFDGGTLQPSAASTAYMGGLTNAFITSNGAKIDVSTGRDITISQVLENAAAQSGTLTKLGVGVLTLTASNSYSGLTTITGGTLAIGNGGTSGTLGSGSVVNNSKLEFNLSSAVTISNSITGTGTVYQTGSGTMTFQPAAGTYSIGAVTANAGNLILKSGTIATTGSDPFNAGYSVGAGARGGTLTIDGATLNVGGGKALKVGAAANGNLDIKSGAATAADLVLGHNGTSVGTQSGGVVVVSNLYHQDGGNGSSYTLTGGSLTVKRIFNNTAAANDFTLNLNGGTLATGTGTTNLIDGGGRGGLEITVNLGAGNTVIDTTNSSASIVRPMGNMAAQAGTFTKAGANVLTLTAANTYSGNTTINGGRLEVSGSIANSAAISVNTGGTLLLSGAGGLDAKLKTTAGIELNSGSATVAALDLGGMTSTLDQAVGALTLSAGSIIDFGSLGAGNTLRFADSHASTWAGTTLKIYNWTSGSDRLFFGADDHVFDGTNGGLTSGQLSQISFFSDGGVTSLGTIGFLTGGTGEIAPVPEPSSVATVVGLLGLIGLRERRKTQNALRLSR